VYGTIVVVGIEMRRHDIPVFIKAFQENLIKTLLQGDTIKDIYDTGLENPLDLVTNSIDLIMTGGEMKISDLVITKTMGREISKYNALFPHVSAALQLNNKGKTPKKGDEVGFINTESKHKNPLRRIKAIDASENDDHNHQQSELAVQYDREKYLQLLLDAAETVLAPFGFDRKLLGDGNARITDWREELRKEREISLQLEREGG
jgi:DNA polymerase elongation subunit (family B)